MITTSEYDHTITPFAHQLEHFKKHCEDKAWGLLWEQGTAKTKPIIDTAAYLYLNDKIDALLIVAPPGVERNWKSDELPKHLPLDVALETRVEVFLTAQKGNIAHKQKIEQLVRYKGLAVLLISYNAFMTKEGKEAVWKFLKRRRCLYALDESHNIKSPKAKRTRSIVASGVYAQFRRILTGTPISVGPFDLYSQIKFLDENFWKRRGIGGSVEFRNHFGVWLTAAEVKSLHGYDPGYDKLISYKNLDQLAMWLSEISDRHLKDDVLDLPPKLYSKRYVEMSAIQKKIYKDLKEEYLHTFEDGQTVEADLPIVRLLRQQQVLCGYLPFELEDYEESTRPKSKVRMLEEKNPRISTLKEIVDEVHHQGIIWARFIPDIDQIMELLGDKACRYDGSIPADQAEKNKLDFQAGKYQWFVGTQQKGGPGLTLHMAKTMIYYSNSFRLIDRLQSEDRFHRAGMDENSVNVIDIICPDTIDTHIVENLRNKVDVASSITGDKLKEWL